MVDFIRPNTNAYSALERRVGDLLSRFPRLKAFAKKGYQRICYLFSLNREAALVLHPKCAIYAIPMYPQADQTEGSPPKELFFGYYDKSPWSPNMAFILLHETTTSEKVNIVVYDLRHDEYRVIGSSRAWNYQQGAMAQWMRGEGPLRVIFNDVINDRLVARIVSIEDGTETIVPWPIQSLHPNGKEALTLNYLRLARLRPEYGYRVTVRNFSPTQPLDQDGIWCVDLTTGEATLIITLAELINQEPCASMLKAEHKVNHLLYSPSGVRFAFMHRWIGPQGKFSRLYVANADGKDGMRLLMDDRVVSHYCWRDDNTLLVWGRKAGFGDHYYLIAVDTGDAQPLGNRLLDVYGDGHPSFSPDRQWLVMDTYPDKTRKQHLLLYKVVSGELLEIGRFFAPWKFDGPRRCDLHPRWSPDGTLISIDSAHEGQRLSYIIDVTALVKGGV